MARWRLAVGVLLLLVVGLPLALPFAQGALDPEAWPIWSDHHRLLVLARHTLLLVFGTLAIALPLGILGAILLYRTDLPLSRLLRFVTVLTLFIPLPLFASAWQAALGSDGLMSLATWSTSPQDDPDISPSGLAWKPWAIGLGAAIWVHAVAGLPWVVWLVGQGLRWVERELEEDALTLAGPAWVLWHVTLRRSLAAIGAAALWVALQTATEITVTDMMQVRTFAEEVYNQFTRRAREQVPAVVAVAAPSVLLTWLLVMAATRRWDRNLPPLTTLTAGPRLFPLGKLRWPCLAVVLAVAGVLAGVPLIGLFWKAGLAGSPETWSLDTVIGSLDKAGRVRGRLVAESLALALAAGGVATVLGLVTCWLAVEARGFRYAVLALLALAWAVPAPIVGVGMLAIIQLIINTVHIRALDVALWYGPSPLPGLWVNLLRFFPCAVAVLWPVVRLLPPELRDAARVDGARPWQELCFVVVPLTGLAAVRAGLAVAVLSLGELGAGKLVETPGSQTFAHELFGQMHYGATRDVAALCLLLLGVVAIGGALVAALGWLWPIPSLTLRALMRTLRAAARSLRRA
jgi:iron(III) transport system permease protein